MSELLFRGTAVVQDGEANAVLCNNCGNMYIEQLNFLRLIVVFPTCLTISSYKKDLEL